jgi:hypothetical protein
VARAPRMGMPIPKIGPDSSRFLIKPGDLTLVKVLVRREPPASVARMRAGAACLLDYELGSGFVTVSDQNTAGLARRPAIRLPLHCLEQALTQPDD